MSDLPIIDPDAWTETPGGLVLPSHLAQPMPIGVDLFAGAGGFSLGFHEAGFHVVAAVEMDYHAVITYAVNLARPGVQFHFDTEERAEGFEKAVRQSLGLTKKKGDLVETCGLLAGDGWISGQPGMPGCEHIWIADVRNLRGADMLEVLGVEEVDAVVGGPPCQGFSTVGKRDVMDPRNSLVFEFVRLAIELRAKSICMENVPGIVNMVTPEGLPVMDVLTEMLETGGFGVRQQIRKALGGKPGARAFARKKAPKAEADEPEQQELFGP